MCTMLSQNTSLKHLFLNPVHLMKPEAVTIFQSCVSNTTLELLTLFWLPGRQPPFLNCWVVISSSTKYTVCIPLRSPHTELSFAEDKEIIAALEWVKKCRQEQTQSSVTILWYATNTVLCSCCFVLLHSGNIMK